MLQRTVDIVMLLLVIAVADPAILLREAASVATSTALEVARSIGERSHDMLHAR
ncbi:MAG: hypothetical protein KDE35_13730 [Geminicoccaceae bacterium]|nr:hypothetical protein [Geminicoccaceae bacterium]